MSESFLPQYHDTTFDPLVNQAREFSAKKLGLQVGGPEKVAIVNERHAEAVKQQLGHLGMNVAGGFDPDSGNVLLAAVGDTQNPEGAFARLGSQLVHELSHGPTGNENQHPFFYEGIAGMAEANYLQWLQTKGRWNAAADFTLNRAGARVWVPGSFRYYDQGPNAAGANSSQGLIAASAINIGMLRTGMRSADVFAASTPGGTRQYDMMKHAVEAIRPGLASEVERYPRTTEGILQATAAVQKAAGPEYSAR